MNYVSIIRRIIKVDEAIHRAYQYLMSDAPTTGRYDEIYDEIVERLLDKRDMLSRSIREYAAYIRTSDRDIRRANICRRKQVKLACTLLGVDYYKIIR